MDNPDVNQPNELCFDEAEPERKRPAAMRKQKMCSGPEYPQSWKAYGYSEFQLGLPRATPKQVDDFDKALSLGIKHMDADDRRLVWAVAHSAAFRERGAKWHQIARMSGLRDGRQIKRRYMDALSRCYYDMKYHEENQLLASVF